jgi:hypothetical protein
VEALDSGVQLTVYRIVQEALTNTLKHAGDPADLRVELAVAVEGSRVSLTVRDNGRGAAAGPANVDGQGLVGMRERAALYGGALTAGPAPGGGWSVTALLDLASSPGPARLEAARAEVLGPGALRPEAHRSAAPTPAGPGPDPVCRPEPGPGPEPRSEPTPDLAPASGPGGGPDAEGVPTVEPGSAAPGGGGAYGAGEAKGDGER